MQESVLTGYGVVGFMYPGRDPARGRTVAQGSPAAQGSPVAHKSHGAVRLSVRSPMLCPKHPQREETSMLAYDSVRGDWANTSLIKSPRGHTTGSGNAQHYMLACVLLIIAGRNCVRIW